MANIQPTCLNIAPEEDYFQRSKAGEMFTTGGTVRTDTSQGRVEIGQMKDSWTADALGHNPCHCFQSVAAC